MVHLPTTPLRRGLVALSIALFVAATAVAADYQFFLSKDLRATLKQQVGKSVKVVDKLIRVWEYQKDGAPIRFDTIRFRCSIPAADSEGIAYLRELMANQEARQGQGGLKTPDATPPLVCLYGRVIPNPLWGEGKGGQSGVAGQEEDEIIIDVEKVEKPRQRFFDEGY